jgi:hypothetical protein
VINLAQTPSVRVSKKVKIIVGSNSKVTEMLQHLLVRQKFGYFGVIAIILIVTAALCWGLTHI